MVHGHIVVDFTDSRLRHPVATMEANVAAELHRLIGAASVLLLQSRTIASQPCRSSCVLLVLGRASCAQAPERLMLQTGQTDIVLVRLCTC